MIPAPGLSKINWDHWKVATSITSYLYLLGISSESMVPCKARPKDLLDTGQACTREHCSLELSQSRNASEQPTTSS